MLADYALNESLIRFLCEMNILLRAKCRQFFVAKDMQPEFRFRVAQQSFKNQHKSIH